MVFSSLRSALVGAFIPWEDGISFATFAIGRKGSTVPNPSVEIEVEVSVEIARESSTQIQGFPACFVGLSLLFKVSQAT